MSKSKFFRVATEGATTDGRNIDRATIEQIAATYNPKTYGARIWLEHIRGTLLYIVGCAPAQIPAMPIVLGEASHVIAAAGRNRAGERRRKGDPGWRPECGKAEREHTPPELAHWLVALAQRCAVQA